MDKPSPRAGACPQPSLSQHPCSPDTPGLLLLETPLGYITHRRSSGARAQLMPLRVRWEQHLLPINRSSEPRLQTLLRQFIYPDVPIVPSSIEQEMMELRGISLLNGAARKSELQTPCCWCYRGKTSQHFCFRQVSSIKKPWFGGRSEENRLWAGSLFPFLSYTRWKTKSFS